MPQQTIIDAPGTTADAPISAAAAALDAGRRKRKPATRAAKPKASCEDCYFHKNLLCALDADKPCPTFRHHEQGLVPPQQLTFVFRQERTRSAWVFEQQS